MWCLFWCFARCQWKFAIETVKQKWQLLWCPLLCFTSAIFCYIILTIIKLIVFYAQIHNNCSLIICAFLNIPDGVILKKYMSKHYFIYIILYTYDLIETYYIPYTILKMLNNFKDPKHYQNKKMYALPYLRISKYVYLI